MTIISSIPDLFIFISHKKGNMIYLNLMNIIVSIYNEHKERILLVLFTHIYLYGLSKDISSNKICNKLHLMASREPSNEFE